MRASAKSRNSRQSERMNTGYLAVQATRKISNSYDLRVILFHSVFQVKNTIETNAVLLQYSYSQPQCEFLLQSRRTN